MNLIHHILILIDILILCVSSKEVWHSYQHNPVHESREEIIVYNISIIENFKIDYPVNRWKRICLEEVCYLAGLQNNSVIILTLNKQNLNQTSHQLQIIENLNPGVVNVELFQQWNSSSQQTDVILLIATQQSELLWYRYRNLEFHLFWNWQIEKQISYLNVFEFEETFYLLVVSQYAAQMTADIYKFELKTNSSNFWLQQKIDLETAIISSATISIRSNFYLALPQTNRVEVYKLKDKHFESFANLTSRFVNEVVAFNIGAKSFLAINGLTAGIYQFVGDGLIREEIAESHTDGINYWLPITPLIYGDETILIAQRSLLHGNHKSLVIEVFTYNGHKFEEHEDIFCLYYGEKILGSLCLPDDHYHKGIEGSVAISLQDTVGILIPRYKRSSELFLLKIGLKQNSNPLQQQLNNLILKQKHMIDLVKTQENRYNKLVRNSDDVSIIKLELLEMEKDIKKLHQRSIQLKEKPIVYKTAIFNGLVKINSTGNFKDIQAEKINGESANELLEDIVLKNSLGKIVSHKTVQNLKTEELTFDKINNQNSSDLVFVTKNVTINGDLFITKPLTIRNNITASEVNGISFQNEVIDIKKPQSLLLQFEQIKSENATVAQINDKFVPNTINDNFDTELLNNQSLFIPHNVHAININGEDFNEFLNRLCLKNINNFIEQNIWIKGNVTILEDADIKYLNDLRFPQEYVLRDDFFSVITGDKTFESVTTSALITEGKIDGVLASDIITLSSNQHIPGITTFANLKITESLNVENSITGKHASKFLENPTLLETNFIKSKATFEGLEIIGKIIVTNQMNGNDLEKRLSDVIYEDEADVVVEAMKEFPKGFSTKNLEINSDSINNIDLKSIVTKNTEQVLNLTRLNGVVEFGNLETPGLYDNINIEKLDEQLVKLNGEQYISSTLIFENNVTVNEFEIKRQLKWNNFHNLNKSIVVDRIIIDGDLNGDIIGFNISSYNNTRLSYSLDQIVNTDFSLNKSEITSIKTPKINSHSIDLSQIRENLKEKLLTGKLAINNLYTNSSLQINNIQKFPTINLAGSFWKSNNPKNSTKLIFQNDVYFDSITISKLSGVDFNTYLQNIVFKNETDVTFSGTKIFNDSINVESLMETKQLNSIELANILSIDGNQTINGPLIVQGNVTFEEKAHVVMSINDVPIYILRNSFNSTKDGIFIKGEVLFNSLSRINNLTINGLANGKPADEVLDNIIYVDDNFHLKGPTIFKKQVIIDKNIKINETLNNVNFDDFIANTVSITKDGTITSPVTFLKSILVTDQISISGTVESKTLNDINVAMWRENAVLIDEGLLKGNFLFENVTVVQNLFIDRINDIDFKTVIPLRSEQSLHDIRFNKVSLYKNVSIGNSTNMRNLTEEYLNTVMLDIDQVVESDVEFVDKIFVEEMKLKGTINEKDIAKIVTTTTNQTLNALYSFNSKINLEKNLVVDGLVNRIDLNNWSSKGLKKASNVSQNVSRNWEIATDLIFDESVGGSGLINNINFTKFYQDIEQKRNYKYQIEKRFIDDYVNICKDLTFMHNKLTKQIYKFSHLEHLQKINLQGTIEYVFSYTYENVSYLLVSEAKNCETYQFIFDNRFRYVKSVHFGHVAQIIPVRSDSVVTFVVRNQEFYSRCKMKGTHLWELTNNQFIKRALLDDQDLLQESLESNTFYGLKNNIVTEFHVESNLEIPVTKYRKWILTENTENAAFAPRGLATGLAVCNGRKLIKLQRDTFTNNEFNPETESIIVGNWSEELNTYLPGRKDRDLAVMKVGFKNNNKNLLAVATQEETSIEGSLDFIKVYENVINGKVFHKVPTYKPSSLLSIDFNNGETFLAFIEDKRDLRFYEYKGVEGFKQKFSLKMPGTKLFQLEIKSNLKKRRVIGLVDNNYIRLMEVVMLGNQIKNNFYCTL